MAEAAGQAAPDWTEPGLFTVAPGVHRIPLPLPGDGLRAVNVYAIESAGDLVLIDAGWALEGSAELLEAALGQIGRGLAEISRCLVTHVHRDHYTMAVVLRRRFGTRVALGIGEKPSLDLVTAGRRDSLTAHLNRLRMCGAAPVVQSIVAFQGKLGGTPDVWEQPDEWLDGQITVRLAGHDLLAVPTPGHTQGHVVFADLGRSLLFAGDHVLPSITPSVGFEAALAEQPLGDYLDSLRMMLQLPDMRLLPAHGAVTEHTHARVRELLVHHEDRLAACLGRVVAGAATAYDVAQELPWTRRGRRFADLDVFNQMLAVFEAAVHLDLLAAGGQVVRRTTADGITYSPVQPGDGSGDGRR
jgi:glyoxylase-like metal-dependent hydrolase (beta-lactamase superfamily II)